jgi:hypothetical protein
VRDVCTQLPVVTCQLSVVSYQLSGGQHVFEPVGWPRSGLLSIVSRQPASAGPRSGYLETGRSEPRRGLHK